VSSQFDQGNLVTMWLESTIIRRPQVSAFGQPNDAVEVTSLLHQIRPPQQRIEARIAVELAKLRIELKHF
jgi:hypothetical protein